MSASIKIDASRLAGFSKRVRVFLDGVSDKSMLLDAIGLGMVSNVQERFETGTDPNGEPWVPVRRKGRPLVKSGLLRDSVSYEVSGSSVRVGSNRIYARTHQFGATIKPKKAKKLRFMAGGKPVFASSVTIPARPFLGWGESDERMVRDTVADFIRGARQGAF